MRRIFYQIGALSIFVLLLIGCVYLIKDNAKPHPIVTIPTQTPLTPVPLTNPPLTQGNSGLILKTPIAGTLISSPLLIEGSAKGMYFEASFPVELRDEKGNILSTGIATAQGDWMTVDYVPFTTSLIFTKPQTAQKGTLVFKKDNPSGLPEYDVTFEIPVKY